VVAAFGVPKQFLSALKGCLVLNLDIQAVLLSTRHTVRFVKAQRDMPKVFSLITILMKFLTNPFWKSFFSIHNPTTLNRQGYDVGTQYRSAIFYTSESQKETAEQYISFLESSKVFSDPIVTTVAPLDVFYDAEENHHDYYDQNSQQSYCQFVISPKIKLLNQRFKQKLKSDET
jgi:hypothetical protein